MAEKNKGGRPPKDKYDIPYMIDQIEKYTKKTDLPILKEVCYQNEWNYDYVMQLQREHEELSQSTKKLLYKKEVQLERLGLFGSINATMAVFSLKQLGWKDKQEVSNSHEIENLTALADLLK